MSKLKYKIGDTVVLKSHIKRWDGKTCVITKFQTSRPENHPYYLVPIGENSDDGRNAYGANESDVVLAEIYNTSLWKALHET